MAAVPVVVVGRKNQFFLPGDEIDREVIQSDICKYLDNDATVRPGDYNGTPGFYIFAYRNLTTEQVSDLKTDSLKLKRERLERQERYKSSARKRGRDVPAQLPQPAQVSYTDSKTHGQSVQRFEERERLRITSETPLPQNSRTYPPQGPPGGLPTPTSSRSDHLYPIVPPSAQPAYQQPTRVKGEYTPPYNTTSESQYVQVSNESRTGYKPGGYQQDSYRYEQFPSKQVPYPGTTQPSVARPYPPQPPSQQIQRSQGYYDDDEMDTRPEHYDEYDERRVDMRSSDRMDTYDDRHARGDWERERERRSERDAPAPTPIRMGPPPNLPPSIQSQPRTATRAEMRPDTRSESRFDARDPRGYDAKFKAPYVDRRGPPR